jgi:hypothetical protein
MTDRKKPGVAFWASVVVVVVLVLYPLSFGPACALVSNEVLPESILTTVYAPCLYLAIEGPYSTQQAIWVWAGICDGENALWNAASEHIGLPALGR